MIIAVFMAVGRDHPPGSTFYSKSNLQEGLSPKMEACIAKCNNIDIKTCDKSCKNEPGRGIKI